VDTVHADIKGNTRVDDLAKRRARKPAHKDYDTLTHIRRLILDAAILFCKDDWLNIIGRGRRTVFPRHGARVPTFADTTCRAEHPTGCPDLVYPYYLPLGEVPSNIILWTINCTYILDTDNFEKGLRNDRYSAPGPLGCK